MDVRAFQNQAELSKHIQRDLYTVTKFHLQICLQLSKLLSQDDNQMFKNVTGMFQS